MSAQSTLTGAVAFSVILFVGFYINGREEYLNVIGEYMELHSTFKESLPNTPKHVVNDGVMTQENVQKYVCM